ncbi:hypothetical protein [Bacillus sp. JJ722]|uniref:hypothetical protein n=1 Tax=Bacillus sp. JJ722 TaxID=3122973 RepID=UPI002FFF872C
MNVQISLHDGITITANIENYNAAELATQLNDPRILVINLGDFIINKNTVKMIAPTTPQ